MHKSIVLNGRLIEYEFTHKKVKNINLRISKGGVVSVSSPRFVSDSKVEDFLHKKADFIIQAIDEMIRRDQNQLRPVAFKDGEQISVFGKPITLRVFVTSGRSFVEYLEPNLVIHAKNLELVKKAYAKWRLVTMKSKINELYNIYYPMFATKGVAPVDTICIRNMKSKWGVCNVTKRKITFNLNLFEVPEELIAYVVVHELAHLIEANHSPRFWSQVEQIMPDYKLRRKALRDY